MPLLHRILASTVLCLATGSGVAHATTDTEVLKQAEQQIRLQWQNTPKLSYHSLSYKGSLQECCENRQFFYVKQVRTLQGTWIPLHELAADTLVFRGEVKGYRPVKTKGGVGYFFCSPGTGELLAYLLMK